LNRRRLTKTIFTHHEQRILQKIIHVCVHRYMPNIRNYVSSC